MAFKNLHDQVQSEPIKSESLAVGFNIIIFSGDSNNAANVKNLYDRGAELQIINVWDSD